MGEPRGVMRLLALLWLAGTLASAETYVVCAGVEQYSDQRLTGVRYAVADAEAMARAFRAAGVPRENVTVLTSEGADPQRLASRGNLVAVLQRVRDLARRGDKVVFLFVGHGLEVDDQQYLLTADTAFDLVAETALSMPLVNRALQGLQASEVLFLLDLSRHAPEASRSDEGAQLTEGLVRGVRPRVLPGGPTAKPILTATLLSCDVDQRAYDDPEAGHGLFTECLLSGLAGAAQGDDDQVWLSGLVKYVQTEVRRRCQKQGRLQNPLLLNPAGGDMVVLKPLAEPLVSLDVTDATLAEVVTDIAGQVGAQVVLGPGVDPNATVTARLELQPLSAALKILVLAHGLLTRREGETYVIEAPGAPPDSAHIATFTAADPRPASWPEYLLWPPTDEPGLLFRVHPRDGMPQVLVPEGGFSAGTKTKYLYEVLEWAKRDSPEPVSRTRKHSIERLLVGEEGQDRYETSAYWIDLHEVTNGQYGEFVRATGHAAGDWSSWSQATSAFHPAGYIMKGDAVAYAAWVGRALPTEAQWEKAARGHSSTLFWWGNQPDPRGGNGDWDATRSECYDDAVKYCLPIARYAPGPYGLYDMIGNVWEWCADGYERYRKWARKDPFRAASSRGSGVLRGGSCLSDPAMLRPGVRWPSDGAADSPATLGFRCVSPP